MIALKSVHEHEADHVQGLCGLNNLPFYPNFVADAFRGIFAHELAFLQACRMVPEGVDMPSP